MKRKKWNKIDEKSLIGQKYGRLTITDTSHRDKNGNLYVKVKCDCGNERTVLYLNLRDGKSKSCGCLSAELSSERAKNYDLTKFHEGRDKGIVDGVGLSQLKVKSWAHNTSGYKGVTWSKQKRKWRAYINIAGKQKHLGFYDDIEEAHQARLEAEDKYINSRD